jgi:hypothetical protein
MRRATRAHSPPTIYGYLHKIGTRRFVIKRPTRSKSLSAFGNNFVEKSPKMRTTVRAAVRRRICMRIDYAGERVRRSCRTETQPRAHRKSPTGLSTPQRRQNSRNFAIHEFSILPIFMDRFRFADYPFGLPDPGKLSFGLGGRTSTPRTKCPCTILGG